MKTLAAVSRAGNAFPVLEMLDLEAPRDDEILVRMVATGICHTDLRIHAGLGPGTPRPVVLGHEGAGIVEHAGKDVTRVKPGDHVVLSGASCGRCPGCAADLPGYCRENLPRNFGAQRMDGSSALRNGSERIHGHFFGQSSFAQYAIAQERTAVKVPHDLPLELLGPLGCGVITGTGAVMKSLALRAGESIVIFGTGGVGLSAVMAAKLVGASRIIAVDVVPQRLALARELGATQTIEGGGDPVEMVARIREFAGGEGTDASLNTTSDPEVYTHAIASLGLRGRAGFVTAPRAPWQPPMMALMLGGRSLRGLVGGDAAPQTFIPLLIEHYREGRLPLDRLVSYYPFERIAAAFEDMRRGAAIKPVLRIAA